MDKSSHSVPQRGFLHPPIPILRRGRQVRDPNGGKKQSPAVEACQDGDLLPGGSFGHAIHGPHSHHLCGLMWLAESRCPLGGQIYLGFGCHEFGEQNGHHQGIWSASACLAGVGFLSPHTLVRVCCSREGNGKAVTLICLFVTLLLRKTGCI